MLQKFGTVDAAHTAEYAEEALRGRALPVPGLPQVQDCLRGTGTAGKEGRVPVHVQPFGQQPPVVAAGHGFVQHLAQGLLGRGGQAEHQVGVGGVGAGAATGARA